MPTNFATTYLKCHDGFVTAHTRSLLINSNTELAVFHSQYHIPLYRPIGKKLILLENSCDIVGTLLVDDRASHVVCWRLCLKIPGSVGNVRGNSLVSRCETICDAPAS